MTIRRKELSVLDSSLLLATPPKQEIDLPQGVRELFSDGAVMPEQFYHPRRCLNLNSGVAELMLAVLGDALNCLQKQTKMNQLSVQRAAQEAEEWLWTDDLHWPFSFLNICLALGLDSHGIRLRMGGWKKRIPYRSPVRRKIQPRRR